MHNTRIIECKGTTKHFNLQRVHQKKSQKTEIYK